MHRFVLVPEGRTDAEWLRLFSLCAVNEELGNCVVSLPFGTVFGIAPTHDACVVDTVEKIKDMRGGVVVLVDGDTACDEYVKTLPKATKPPEHIVQWPERIGNRRCGWLGPGDEQSLVQADTSGDFDSTDNDAGDRRSIQQATKEKGKKTDLLAYEAVTTGILMSAKAKIQGAKSLGSICRND